MQGEPRPRPATRGPQTPSWEAPGPQTPSWEAWGRRHGHCRLLGRGVGEAEAQPLPVPASGRDGQRPRPHKASKRSFIPAEARAPLSSCPWATTARPGVLADSRPEAHQGQHIRDTWGLVPVLFSKKMDASWKRPVLGLGDAGGGRTRGQEGTKPDPWSLEPSPREDPASGP